MYFLKTKKLPATQFTHFAYQLQIFSKLSREKIYLFRCIENIYELGTLSDNRRNDEDNYYCTQKTVNKHTVNYPRANWLGPGFDQILILTNPLRASMFAIARAKLLFQTAVPQL